MSEDRMRVIQPPGTPFHEQVKWELDGQDSADVIVYYFDGNTKSPITLMELGLYINDTDVYHKIHVFCTKDFWRYGNVKMVCDKWKVPVYEDETIFIESIKQSIKELV
jgi:hypothetical protein